MPQNARVIAFTISELLRENQQGELGVGGGGEGGGGVNYPHPPRLGGFSLIFHSSGNTDSFT